MVTVPVVTPPLNVAPEDLVIVTPVVNSVLPKAVPTVIVPVLLKMVVPAILLSAPVIDTL